MIDFIASLRERYTSSRSGRKRAAIDLAQEGFVGMWEDREDMEDSSAWVRRSREREWVKQGG